MNRRFRRCTAPAIADGNVNQRSNAAVLFAARVVEAMRLRMADVSLGLILPIHTTPGI